MDIIDVVKTYFSVLSILSKVFVDIRLVNFHLPYINKIIFQINGKMLSFPFK